jgi:hypothetical protein
MLMVVATLLHPSRETASTIVASESRLVAAHVVYTVAWLLVLLGGIAMIRTATLRRWAGVLVAVGAPAHLLGFGIAQLVSTAAWPIAIVGSVSLGVGLG